MTTQISRPQGRNAQKVIAMRKATPCLTLEQVGKEVGLTRERVRQILQRNCLPTKHYIPRKHCSACGKVLQNVNTTGYCFQCLRETKQVPVICNGCGVLFYRLQSEVLARTEERGYSGKQFHSRQCFGKHLGTNYGFREHPENKYRFKVAR